VNRKYSTVLKFSFGITNNSRAVENKKQQVKSKTMPLARAIALKGGLLQHSDM
jgi:hypothetical protein